MKQQILIQLLLFFCLSNVNSQDTIRVPEDFASIQTALNDAFGGSTILVAPGIYYENLVWPNRASLKLIGEEGSEVTIIDGSLSGRVVTMETFFNASIDSTVLKGFTIQNGHFVGDGAGLYIRQGDQTLMDLKVIDNTSVGGDIAGGGVYLRSFSGLIENCEFSGNLINSNSRAYGAGLNIAMDGDVEIRNCVFDSNESSSYNWCHGGGLYIDPDFLFLDTLTISNCTFNGNSTASPDWSYGAGMYVSPFDSLYIRIDSSSFTNNTTNSGGWSKGGGLYTGSYALEMNACIFDSNSAISGAAIFLDDLNGDILQQTSITSCQIKNNESLVSGPNTGAAIEMDLQLMELRMVNSLISNNLAQSIYFDGGTQGNTNDSNLNLSHCTIANNSHSLETKNVRLEGINSIFWNDGQEEINDSNSNPSNIEMTNCIIKNGSFGSSNSAQDPDFQDFVSFIPRKESPCIGAGIATNIITDIDNNTRPLPIGTMPDIGAYEIDQSTANLNHIFEDQIIAYPNPASSTIYLSDLVDKVFVYDAQGKLVSSLELTQEVNVKLLEAGTYFVEYWMDGEVGTDRWVIVR